MARLVKATLSVVFVALLQASSQAATGAIVGVVTDVTGGTIPGATVTVIPATGPQRLVVTKADGSYSVVDLPIGVTRLRVALEGFETAVIDRVMVRPGAENPCDVVLHVPGTHGVVPRKLRPASPETEALVKQAIENLWPDKIPGGNVLKGSRLISVRQEVPQLGAILSQAALPVRSGYEFRLTSIDAVQAEADRIKKSVYFIIVDSARISLDSATIWIGADMILPSDSRTVSLCCCVGHGEFTKKDGTWTFVKWLSTICS